jgi:hypothetical protein
MVKAGLDRMEGREVVPSSFMPLGYRARDLSSLMATLAAARAWEVLAVVARVAASTCV